MGLSKLLNKVNKAKSAINSLKGISSKIQSLNYNSQIDKLGEEAKKAQDFLKDSRKREAQLLGGVEKSQTAAKKSPKGNDIEFRYPLNDDIENTIVFSIRPRRKRNGEAGKNILSDVSTEIMLYIPEGISSEADVSYGKESIGRGARTGQDVANSLDQAGGFNIGGKNLSAGLAAAGNAAVAVGDAILTKLGDAASGGAQNIREGRSANPMMEVMFEGVDFREFKFDYEFWPKNELEAREVEQIIFTFRSAMLPDTYGAGSEAAQSGVENYFNFPNIFDVEFDGPIADRLDGFLPMVLKSCSVDHFNGNRVATFANGQPLSTSMSLQFQEIKILSQESYQEISPFGDKSITSMGSMQDEAMENKSFWKGSKG